MGKAGPVLFCLLFAVPFGGVGAFASWAIVSTVREASRVRDWVAVPATVESASVETSEGDDSTTYKANARYRYAFEGREYAGSRLGLSAVGGFDNLDDWHLEVGERLQAAHAAGRTVTVWVNPANAAESIYDRDIRWSEIVFLVPFALAFGGVGVGALVVMGYLLRGTDSGGGMQAAIGRAVGEGRARRSGGGDGGAGFLWLFAFFWNAIAFPAAFLALPDIVANEEWVGLLVLLFPLVGLGLLWAAVSASWKAWRGRRAPEVAATRAPAASPAPAGAMASQAARAMFDRPSGVGIGERFAGAGPSPIEIPPGVAQVEERGGTLTLRYSARRRLGLVIVLFIVGTVLALVGTGFLAGEESRLVGAIAIAAGVLFDLGGVALLASHLVVTVRPGEIAVVRTGLFGRRSWRVRREAIRAIRSSVAYSVNDRPYYSVYADTGDESVPVGNSIKGRELAEALARRITAALGAPASLVSRVPHPHSD